MTKSKKTLLLVLSLLIAVSCFIFNGITQKTFANDDSVPTSITVTETTLNAGTIESNGYKKIFDYWSNTTSVTYSENGALIEGTRIDNAMNFIAGPISISNGSKLEMVINFPIRDTNGEVIDGALLNKPKILLYDGEEELAGIEAIFWGDSYKTDVDYVTAEFSAFGKKAEGVKLPKRAFEQGGSLKIGFSVETGWMTEIYDEETEIFTYKNVFSDDEIVAFSPTTYTDVTRVRVCHKWADTCTKTAVCVKEVNGQSFCAKNGQITFTELMNVSNLKTEKDVIFTTNQTVKFELIGIDFTKNVKDFTKTTDAEIWAHALATTSGDIGWGEGSGIYVTLQKEGGSASTTFYSDSWGAKGHTPITFTLGSAGNYTLTITFLTKTGNVTTRTMDIVALSIPKILVENAENVGYVSEKVNLATAKLFDEDGVTELESDINVAVTLDNEPVEIVDNSFTPDKEGTYVVTYTTVYDGRTFTYTYSITVTVDQITSIKIATNPTKIQYLVGEEFDKAGMVVKAVYQSGKEVEITDYEIRKTLIEEGDSSVVIEYQDKMTVLSLTIKTAKEKSGCNGSLIVTLPFITCVALGAMLLAKKKEN